MDEKLFANRMGTTHKSFIREMLKVTEDPKNISFAGGNNTLRLNFSIILYIFINIQALR